MAPGADGRGYWLLNSVGQVWTLGNVPYYGDGYVPSGSAGTGIAATAPLLGPVNHSNRIKETSMANMNAALEAQARRLLGAG